MQKTENFDPDKRGLYKCKVLKRRKVLYKPIWKPLTGSFLRSKTTQRENIGPFTLAKTKIPRFFVVPFTLPEKPITFRGFGKKSACAKKLESHTVFW